MPTEIERRFLVLEMNQSILHDSASAQFIQGYLMSSSDFEQLRVRIIDGKHAIFARKRGIGLLRQEDEKECTDVDAAKFLLAHCRDTVSKTRYFIEGWEVDFYDAPLQGLIIAEFEMVSLDQEVVLPSWIHRAVEVTDSISNLHLARLSTTLRNRDTAEDFSLIEELLRYTKVIPRIVLTGGPCSGKSTFMQMLKDQHEVSFQCVPETATIIISQVGITPTSLLEMRRFQETVYQVQRIFELTSTEHAGGKGKKALVLDRGTVDGAAYLPGGTEELEKICNTSLDYEYGQYDLVLCFEVPPEDVYESEKKNNPARGETYEEALALQSRIQEVWGGHPNFHLISNRHGWPDKVENALKRIGDFVEL